MEAIIEHSVLGGKIGAIPSKSMAHRYFIAAALAKAPSFVTCQGTSEDIEATLRCLEAMGARIRRQDGGIEIDPAKGAGKADFYCGESGSTLRFLLPVAAALGIQGRFHGEGRLPKRPLSPLYEELEAHGCSLTPQGENPLCCRGRLKPGVFQLPGNVSSQYITGLLFALPLLEGDSKIVLTSSLESARYVDMTLQVLREYGIQINKNKEGWVVPGGQEYRPKAHSNVEGDWSNAAFWLTAGALSPKGITVTGLDRKSAQGDKKILEYLAAMGARVTEEASGIRVCQGERKGVDIDAQDIPDLVPILAAAASVSRGTARIYNAARLRLKESDRLKTVSETLNNLGANVKELPDGLEITGRSHLTGGSVQAAGDHRIAMMAAVAASVSEGTVKITGAQAVNKSYPGFFEDYIKLGGKVVLD